MKKKKAFVTYSKFSTYQWQILITDAKGKTITDFLVGSLNAVKPAAIKWGKENKYDVQFMDDTAAAAEMVKLAKKQKKDAGNEEGDEKVWDEHGNLINKPDQDSETPEEK